MGEYSAVNGYCGDPGDPAPFSQPVVLPFPPHNSKKRTYVTAGEAKSVGAEPCTLQVVPKTRRASAEPLLDILEAGGGQPDEYDGGTASYGMPRTPTLTRPPSNSTLNAELRRQSYRSAMDDSMNSSQEGDRASTGSGPVVTATIAPTAMSLPPVSPPPYDPPPAPTRVRYASPALSGGGGAGTVGGAGAPTDPAYWLHHYSKEDTHRHQTPTRFGGDYGAGDRSRLMSPIATGKSKSNTGGWARRYAFLKFSQALQVGNTLIGSLPNM